MSDANAVRARQEERLHRRLWSAWWSNLLVWVILLVLLVASLAIAYVPLGVWNLPVGIAIAGMKSLLVALVFMELTKGAALIRLAAAAGFIFLAVMFAMMFCDLLSR
jgi:cytochrome c oxidase subunit 4